jgi:hypothetical protein
MITVNIILIQIKKAVWVSTGTHFLYNVKFQLTRHGLYKWNKMFTKKYFSIGFIHLGNICDR